MLYNQIAPLNLATCMHHLIRRITDSYYYNKSQLILSKFNIIIVQAVIVRVNNKKQQPIDSPDITANID